MEKNKKEAIAIFIDSLIDSEGFVKDLKEDYFLNKVSKMLLEFDKVTIDCFDVTRDEYEKIANITKTIRNLKRLGINPTLKNISKIVRTNPWRMRNLMVKYGMFDESTKKIVDQFSSAIDFNFTFGDFYEEND